MKKRIAMFLLLLLCVLSLIGCHTPAQEPDEGDMPVTDDSDAEALVSHTPSDDATEPERVEIDGTVRVELDAAAIADAELITIGFTVANFAGAMADAVMGLETDWSVYLPAEGCVAVEKAMAEVAMYVEALGFTEPVAKALAASPGAAAGQIVFTAEDAKAWNAAGKKVVLVRLE